MIHHFSHNSTSSFQWCVWRQSCSLGRFVKLQHRRSHFTLIANMTAVQPSGSWGAIYLPRLPLQRLLITPSYSVHVSQWTATSGCESAPYATLAVEETEGRNNWVSRIRLSAELVVRSFKLRRAANCSCKANWFYLKTLTGSQGLHSNGSW